MSHASSTLQARRAFRFKHRLSVHGIFLAFVLLTIALFIVAVRRRQLTPTMFIFFGCALLLFVFTGTVMALAESELVIDDCAISRRLFGHTWQKMEWDSVSEAEVLYLGNGLDDTKGIALYPKDKATAPLSVRRTGGRLAFLMQFHDMQCLLDALNEQLHRRSIKIVSTIDETKRTITAL